MVHRRIGARIATIVAGAALTFTAAAPSTADTVTIQATQVTVNVSCAASGGYSWNATIIDATPNAQYGVMAKVNTWSSGGQGGQFDYSYVGSLVTGSYGIGTSSTYSSPGSAGTTKVQVSVKIGGVSGVGSDTC